MNIQLIASVLFGLALLHTFTASYFSKISKKFSVGSIFENLFHLMGEVEVVFGFWSGILLLFLLSFFGFKSENGVIPYLQSINYTEAIFVFVIMVMAATRPVVLLAEQIIFFFSRLIFFLPKKIAFYVATMIFGPLLGSFITEPAAMTLTAFILLDYFYSQKKSDLFKYATLALLFVNVSIGGTLTHFAAPPILVVASKWNWNSMYVFTNIGLKSLMAIIVSTTIVTFVLRKELSGKLIIKANHQNRMLPPWWIKLLHVIFLAMVVYGAHYPVFFVGVFLFFIGMVDVTREYQDQLKIKEGLLVGFFLAGLLTLGQLQAWWISPLLNGLGDNTLYFVSTALTAVTDNAALTYLGSLAPLSDSAKLALASGAVTGGGLTVIANAPNPAGYSILKDSFGGSGISAFRLFLYALVPTLISVLIFQF